MKDILILIMRAAVTGMTSAVILAAALIFSALQLAVRAARKPVGEN
ncbi:MAG: hypothetical protein PUK49_10505 [Oscillospiraceae bacterium]|nr:hypothetical protein [Oscillospiraceae bacterium]